jgi:hypothetical protein
MTQFIQLRSQSTAVFRWLIDQFRIFSTSVSISAGVRPFSAA